MDSTSNPAQLVRDYAAQCNGSNDMHQHWSKRLIYSDGVLFVAETCGAHWLVDLVASWQIKAKVALEEFQVWELRRMRGGACLATCDDGNGNVVARQRIPYSDFPADLMPFRLYVEGGALMLPEER